MSKNGIDWTPATSPSSPAPPNNGMIMMLNVLEPWQNTEIKDLKNHLLVVPQTTPPKKNNNKKTSK